MQECSNVLAFRWKRIADPNSQHTQTHTCTPYIWVSGVQFRFYILRDSLLLVFPRFASLHFAWIAVFFSLSLSTATTRHTHVLFAPQLWVNWGFSFTLLFYCAPQIARCNYKQIRTSTYVYGASSVVKCCIVYITYYTIPYTIHNWGDFTS